MWHGAGRLAKAGALLFISLTASGRLQPQMILTCPACDTKYVVKDGAIPSAGRQVRCASCKHSWHQDPEAGLPEQEAAPAEQPQGTVDFGGPPQPQPDAEPEPVAEIPAAAEADMMVAEEPQPDVGYHEAEWEDVREEASEDPSSPPAEAIRAGGSWEPPAPELAEELPVETYQPPAPAEEEFVGYAPIDGDDEPHKRRWPLLIGIILLIVAAAAAFWFLAPPEWKARAGIAETGATPLQLMITNRDRQVLESGNELVAISGRVINPTDDEQRVPPIRAELRDSRTKTLVHSWTIAAPAQTLAPRSSASFNSAEVDVPKGGDELTVTLGG
jgi:predicted Zn finger-like uncharacterized protein